MGADNVWLKRLESGACKCNACHVIYAKGDIPEGARCDSIVHKGKCEKPCNWTGVITLNQRRCPRCNRKLKGIRDEICSGILLPLKKR